MNCETSKPIDIQGHRGCRGLMPENTIPAFTKAIELGVHTLELDVVVSKDQVVVVSHEPYMNSEICLDVNGNEIPEADDKNYNLYHMTFDSIQLYDCGLKPHPRFPNQQKMNANKPALDEVIKRSKLLNPDIKFNIEIKSEQAYDNLYTPEPSNFVALVLKVIKENDAFNKTNLQSFDERVLEAIKKQAPAMAVALLVDEHEDIWKKMEVLSYKPEIISPYFKLLTPETVKKLHAENFKVIPWTINEIKDLHYMIGLNVDGIITDYPDRLLTVISAQVGIY